MDIKLATKIYNVMCESESLTKDMSVGDQYKAISEANVLNVIKPLLKDHGLIIIPVKAEITQNNKLSQLTAQYKIIDIDTGEFEILATVGNGTDSQDKGSGKAWTYAYKCLLQKTFCLFSGEDTDNTHSDDIEKEQVKEESTVTTAMLNEAINASKTHTIDEVLKHYNDNRKKGTHNADEIKFLPQTAKQYYYKKAKGE